MTQPMVSTDVLHLTAEIDDLRNQVRSLKRIVAPLLYGRDSLRELAEQQQNANLRALVRMADRYWQGVKLDDAERIAYLEDRLRSLGQHPDADPDCDYCRGNGERYWHTADCHSEYCALAGGYHDCNGNVEECPCVVTPTRPG